METWSCVSEHNSPGASLRYLPSGVMLKWKDGKPQSILWSIATCLNDRVNYITIRKHSRESLLTINIHISLILPLLIVPNSVVDPLQQQLSVALCNEFPSQATLHWPWWRGVIDHSPLAALCDPQWCCMIEHPPLVAQHSPLWYCMMEHTLWPLSISLRGTVW